MAQRQDDGLDAEFDSAVAESLEDRAVEFRSLFAFIRLLLEQYGYWSPSIEDWFEMSRHGMAMNFFLGPIMFLLWIWSNIRFYTSLGAGKFMERAQMWSVKRFFFRFVNRISTVRYIGGILFLLFMVASGFTLVTVLAMLVSYPVVTIPVLLGAYAMYLVIEHGGVATFSFTENWVWGSLLLVSVLAGVFGLPQAFGVVAVVVGSQELWSMAVVLGVVGIGVSVHRVVRRDVTELAQFTLRRDYGLAHPVNMWIVPFPFRPMVWMVAARVSALGAVLVVATMSHWSETAVIVALTVPYVVGGVYLVKRSVAFFLVSLLPEDHEIEENPVEALQD